MCHGPIAVKRAGAAGRQTAWPWQVATAAALVVGIGLLQGPIRENSATYDEVTYFKVAATWWRTGSQDRITRMGSPLTFWKLQQAPTLMLLDRGGRSDWIDRPERHQATLLPALRIGACWIWGAGLIVTACWARRRYGLRAMAAAAWLYALSPNLIAHGSLVTMEMPLIAASSAMFFCFARFLDRGQWRWFVLSAALAGLAFSCKFTAVVFPPILAAAWWLERLAGGERRRIRMTFRVILGMVAYAIVMMSMNLALTGFATIPLSERVGMHPVVDDRLGPWAARILEVPLPQDWVGFARQMFHQRGGGPSYLLGERRMHGWWYYYLVCLAVKLPLTIGFMILARLGLLILRSLRTPVEPPVSFTHCVLGKATRAEALMPRPRPLPGEIRPDASNETPNRVADDLNPLQRGSDVRGASHRGANGWRADERLIVVTVALFLVLVSVGSSRNYGLRYLLPLAGLGIVWCSGLAEAGVVGRVILLLGLCGQAAAVVSVHPAELSYFNRLAGGPIGGRHILADSNLDWGQGAIRLARWQRSKPEHADLTTYYFGDTDPHYYGVAGTTYVIDAGTVHPRLPARFTASTRFVAVSASLQFGPWGPPGYFDRLKNVKPAGILADGTIAIYRTADAFGPES